MQKYICNHFRVCSYDCIRRVPHSDKYYIQGYCSGSRSVKVKDIIVPFVYYMEKTLNEQERNQSSELSS